MPLTDGELILKLKQNDTTAFDELFRRYQDSAYRFAFYLCRNRHDADDLFQNTWLRAVKYLPSSSRIRDFKAWIFTIIVNLHRDELRKKKVRRIFSPLRSEKSDTEHEDFEYTTVPTVVDESNQIDIQLALDKAIAELPLKQRRVFVMKEIEGLKHSEISEILNTPVGTIKSLLHRGVRKLQQNLSEFHSD